MSEERDPEEALQGISDKVAEGDEPSQSEREFLEGEEVELEDEGDLSDFDVTR
jgi:hypothetical protein